LNPKKYSKSIFTEIPALVKKLKKEIFEQNEAIESLADALFQINYRTPLKFLPKGVFTFIGPPNCGKKILAEKFWHYYSEKTKFKIFAMSQYSEAEEGYLLYGLKNEENNQSELGGLISLIKKNKANIIVFSEIEKAANQVQIGLLNFLLNPEEYEVNLEKSIIIFTTNSEKTVFNKNNQQNKLRGNLFLTEVFFRQKIKNREQTSKTINEDLFSYLSQNQLIFLQKRGIGALIKILTTELRESTEYFTKMTGIKVFYQNIDIFVGFVSLSLSPYIDSLARKKINEQFFTRINDFIKKTNLIPKEVIFLISGKNKKDLFKVYQDLPFWEKELKSKKQFFYLKWREKYSGDKLYLELVNYRIKKIPETTEFISGEDFPIFQYSNVKFRDIAGQKKSKNELKEIVRLLKEPKVLEKFKINKPKGLLLYGPEGVGKSMLVKAMAKEADLPYIRVSGSLIFDSLYLQSVFEKAKEAGPCLIFLENIDLKVIIDGVLASFPGDQIITELEAITEEKIFVVATATALAEVHSGILKPGRIDVFIEVPELDKEARKFYINKILKKPNDGKINVERINHYISGMNANDLERLERLVVLQVLKNNLTKINEEIIIEQINIIKYGHKLESNRLRNFEEDLKKTAYHEAGHAILSLILQPEIKIEQVTISPRSEALGFVSYNIEESLSNTSRKELINSICVLLAGRVAKVKKFGEDGMDSGAINDLEQATAHAYYAISSFGMDEELGFISVGLINDEEKQQILAKKIEERLLHWLERYKKITEELVNLHWKKIETLALELLANQVVEGPELERIIKEE